MKILEEIPDFESFKKMIREKKEDQQYSSGCLMGYFDIDPDYYTGFVNIDLEDIYNNEENEYGIEIEPHVTVLYGLHDNEINEDDIVKLFTLIKPFKVEFNNISLFENEKFDVLKFDINDEYLKIVNSIVESKFPNTQSFPEYHPHCTIAYLKPGTGKKYVTELNEKVEMYITNWVYSQSNSRKISIDDEGKITILRSAKNEEIDSVDENIEYNGYDIRITPHQKFDNAYLFSAYKDDMYKFGFRGPVSYNEGLTQIKTLIDNNG